MARLAAFWPWDRTVGAAASQGRGGWRHPGHIFQRSRDRSPGVRHLPGV